MLIPPAGSRYSPWWMHSHRRIALFIEIQLKLNSFAAPHPLPPPRWIYDRRAAIPTSLRLPSFVKYFHPLLTVISHLARMIDVTATRRTLTKIYETFEGPKLRVIYTGCPILIYKRNCLRSYLSFKSWAAFALWNSRFVIHTFENVVKELESR